MKPDIPNSQNLLSAKLSSLNQSPKYWIVLFVQVHCFFLFNFAQLLSFYVDYISHCFNVRSPERTWAQSVSYTSLSSFVLAFLLSVSHLLFLPSAVKHAGQASSWISTSVLTEGAIIFFAYYLLNFSDLRKCFLAQLP